MPESDEVAEIHHAGGIWPYWGSIIWRCPSLKTPYIQRATGRQRFGITFASNLYDVDQRGADMLTNSGKSLRRVMIYGALSVFAASMLAFGQDPAQDPGQNPPPDPAQNPVQNPAPAAPQAPPPTTPGWHRFSTPPPQPAPPPTAAAPQADPPPAAVPDHLTLPAGAFITVRVDQFLSSDKNKAGDGFSATLSRPLVADGLVVSRRGEMLGGHVVDAKKAGRVKGVSQLQITLNTLTLADGQQIPVQTELTSITGPTSNGRDAAAIVGTTATGAAIGAAAAWGTGAAIGAGAGLVASTIGVLVTRGHPTVIYPESQLTFRLAKPVTFSTEHSPQAFVAVTAPSQRAGLQGPPQGPGYQQGCPGPGCAPYPPPYYYAPYPYYPYYWGPSFGFFYGGGFYGRGFYGRGYGFRR